jgi:tripartite ATP-independent transporter DctP family solute receptor
MGLPSWDGIQVRRGWPGRIFLPGWIRFLGCLIVLMTACLVVSSCREDSGTRRIKIAHGLPTGHPVHHALVYFGERVDLHSKGTLRLEIHPNEQLGTEREAIELLQIGSVGMTKVSASVMESFVPEYGVFSLPYLFRDDRHRAAVLDSEIGSEILQAGGRYGVRGLAYYDAGSRSFYTRDRPIHKPADLIGLKIRTQESPSAIRMVRALGGSATPIAWGELYTALQQGVVDGAENNPPSFYLSRHYEVCKFYSLDEHTAVPDVLLVSAHLWDRLTVSERAALQQAALESGQFQRELWASATDEAMRSLEAAGVEILRPGKSLFAASVEPLYQSLRKSSAVARLSERIKAMR